MSSRNQIRPENTKLITFFYFFLLLYTIAALIWWGILLHQQNQEITQLKLQNLTLQKNNSLAEVNYIQSLEQINRENRLRNLQYIGEGGAFLVIILFSAGYVFQAIRRQLRFSRQQQNFMMAVTHELKSPIAVIRLNLETLQKRKLDESRQRTFYANTLGEVDRLNRLSSNMLLASQLDSRQYHLIKEPINLTNLLQHLVKESNTRVLHHLIESKIDPDIHVMGDIFMLQIACSNLLENAVKYAPKESTIGVWLRMKDEMAILQISDEGEGIPLDERKKIFNRFYRVGNENTRKSKGTGLGLFLTKKIVEQHGGRISVTDNLPKGSIFDIKLPLLPG